MEHGGQTSARINPSASTLNGFTLLFGGHSDQGLATVDEAVAVAVAVAVVMVMVQTVEALLA
jgi:hypothetical protein